MIRDGIRALIAMAAFAALLCLAASLAFAAEAAPPPQLPAGFSCADVRAKVSELGRIRAVALALENGATWAQIREARKCLR